MRKTVIFALLLTFLSGAVVLASTPDSGEVSGQSDDHVKPGVFDGYYGESIWALVWIFALVAVLWKFAWKPLLVSIRGREEYIAKQFSDADKTLKEAEDVLADYKSKLGDVDIEGKGILDSYLKRAETQSRELAEKTRGELDELRHKLKAEVEHERLEAREQFWDQAGDIVIDLGKEVLGKTMDCEDHQKLIDQAVLRLKAEETKQARQETE